MSSGGSYLSGSNPLSVFAADETNNNHKLIINWPGGAKTKMEGIRANRIYEIEDPESAYSVQTAARATNNKSENLLFKDISDRVPFVHKEQDFDDFEAQPLLPVKLSRLGPGVAWIDINGDNNDDLIVGASKDGNIGFLQTAGIGDLKPYNLRI